MKRSGNDLVFVSQATRIKSEFKGQGLLHEFREFILAYLKTEFPSHNCILMGTEKPGRPSQLHGKQDNDNSERMNQIKKDSKPLIE